jgi:hypothetical protein
MLGASYRALLDLRLTKRRMSNYNSFVPALGWRAIAGGTPR